MKYLLIILVAFGAYSWWTHRTPPASPTAAASTAAAQPAATQAAPAPAADPAAAGASWPKRQIDRAQAAADAVKAQRQGL